MKNIARPNRPHHCFLDEAGDATFYAKGKIPAVGNNGVSTSFILGLVRFHEPLDPIRKKIIELQQHVQKDVYYKAVPSIQKKITRGDFYFHATDDPAEVRKTFFEFIKSLDCTFEAVVAAKTVTRFEQQHNRNDTEFYADVLSLLLRGTFQHDGRLVLNIAQRGKSTRNTVLQKARQKAERRFIEATRTEVVKTDVIFNIQDHIAEPLLNVADYFCWALQRSVERGETRYCDFLEDKISIVLDLYAPKSDEDWGNYCDSGKLALGEKRISPPLH